MQMETSLNKKLFPVFIVKFSTNGLSYQPSAALINIDKYHSECTHHA